MKKIFFSAALMGLALAACTNNDEIFVEEEKGIETISAEIIQPAGVSSRIIIGDQLADGTYPVKWRADNPATKADEADVIYVYDSKGNAGRFFYTEATSSSKGVFVRDAKCGQAIMDIKNALCVPTSVGRPNDLPKSIDGEFNYMSTMMYTRGAENAPMYGEMKDGVLQFKQVTGMLEINIPNLSDFRPDENSMIGVRIAAYDKYVDKGNEANQEKYITSTSAHIDFTDVNNPQLILDGGQKGYVGLFLQKNVALGNKLHCPLITGEYAALEIDIWRNTNFSSESGRLSETVVITPAAGQSTFTIEKKLYSITKEFVKKQSK